MPLNAMLGIKMVVWNFMKVLNVAQEKEKSFMFFWGKKAWTIFFPFKLSPRQAR